MSSESTAKLEEENRKLRNELSKIEEKALRYELLFELSDDAILVIENDKFIDCNQAVVKMLGYKNKHEILNTHPSELSPEKQPDGRFSYEKAQEMMALALQNGSHHFEWTHVKANGDSFPVEVWLSSVKYMDKLLINTIWRDLTESKKAEEKIQASLREKETLLKEIHHRVKNNLQVITSLLSLQSGFIDNKETKTLFRYSQYRINSMAIIHEMLYKTDNLSRIDYGEYLQQLVSGVVTSMKGSDNIIDITIEVKDLFLNIDTSIPLGLMINEIVTNSLKHGLEENKGKLDIKVEKLDYPNFILRIGDNGKGFPDDLNFENTKSLGLKLIHNLSKQLKGSIQRDKDKKGTNYIVEFKEIDQSA